MEKFQQLRMGFLAVEIDLEISIPTLERVLEMAK
jgi:hypothetical protein